MAVVLETERLSLSPLTRGDWGALCGILQDVKVMYAYEHPFSDAEVEDWLTRQWKRYEQDGFGLWAVRRKTDGVFVGQAGLTMQELPSGWVAEVGYLMNRAFWRQGYATEAAIGCRDYAFNRRNLPAVYAIIRTNNLPSRAVAERSGMRCVGEVVKHYYHRDMPHVVYRVTQSDLRGGVE